MKSDTSTIIFPINLKNKEKKKISIAENIKIWNRNYKFRDQTMKRLTKVMIQG